MEVESGSFMIGVIVAVVLFWFIDKVFEYFRVASTTKQGPRRDLHMLPVGADLSVAQACRKYYDIAGAPDWRDLWECYPLMNPGEVLVTMRRDHDGAIWVFQLSDLRPGQMTHRSQKFYEQTYDRLPDNYRVRTNWRLVVN